MKLRRCETQITEKNLHAPLKWFRIIVVGVEGTSIEERKRDSKEETGRGDSTYAESPPVKQMSLSSVAEENWSSEGPVPGVTQLISSTARIKTQFCIPPGSYLPCKISSPLLAHPSLLVLLLLLFIIFFLSLNLHPLAYTRDSLKVQRSHSKTFPPFSLSLEGRLQKAKRNIR